MSRTRRCQNATGTRPIPQPQCTRAPHAQICNTAALQERRVLHMKRVKHTVTHATRSTHATALAHLHSIVELLAEANHLCQSDANQRSLNEPRRHTHTYTQTQTPTPTQTQTQTQTHTDTYTYTDARVSATRASLQHVHSVTPSCCLRSQGRQKSRRRWQRRS
jgi:hypothetical protein